MLEMTVARLAPREFGGSRLCFFNASLTTPRCALAVSGRDGCESQLRDDEKAKDEVVGRTKGKGMVRWGLYGGRRPLAKEADEMMSCIRAKKKNKVGGSLLSLGDVVKALACWRRFCWT